MCGSFVIDCDLSELIDPIYLLNKYSFICCFIMIIISNCVEKMLSDFFNSSRIFKGKLN